MRCVAGIALACALVLGACGDSDGETAETRDESAQTTTTTAKGTTTTVPIEVLEREYAAIIEDSCSSAVSASLVGFDYTTHVAFPERYGPVASKQDMIEQVRACAEPQREERRATECARSPETEQINRDPDRYTGECYTLFSQVSQFDQATGPCAFRGWWDSEGHEYNFDYKGDNGVFTTDEPCPELDPVGVDDTVRLVAVVAGGLEYDTTIGGSAHAVMFQILEVEMVRDE